ncbi:anti-sigma factor [Halopseudomonas pachastrellae]|nr:anti-sigma factor [Halopseudomonas pachastrellae]
MLKCKGLVALSSTCWTVNCLETAHRGVRTHLAMCVHCRRFIRQLRVSQHVIRHLSDEQAPELEALLKAMQAQQQQGSDAVSGDSAK